MTELPKISRMQFGVIDEEYMNTLADAADNFNKLKPAIDDMLAKSSGQVSRPFLAEITNVNDFTEIEIQRSDGNTEDVVVVWSYLWKRVEIEKVETDPSATEIVVVDTDPGLNSYWISRSYDLDEDGEWTGLVSGTAFNLAELANPKSYLFGGIVFGVNVKQEAYPLGFYPVGMRVGDFVYLQKIYTTDMRAIYIFDRQGTHDGSCV